MGIRIRPAEVEVPCNTPFQYDLLDREAPAKFLTQLVDGIDGPCVMAIDAPWGAGKTTFLKMWSRYLRNEGFPVVEFNAWETDHAADPFVALVSELKEGLAEFDEGSLKEKIKKTADAAVQVALRAVPGLIRIAASGVLGVHPPIEKEIGTLLASYAEKRLNKYSEDQKSIGTFRNRLQEMASDLAECRKHPLMILIDELDRCRPSYAIALIEVAKHLFEADHVVFVLSVNRTQLAHSVRALYGGSFDAPGYLRRFFDIDFRLPDSDRREFLRAMLNEVPVAGTTDLMRKFFGTSDLSLRHVGQAIRRLHLVAASLPKRLWTAATVALAVRTIDVDLCRRFVTEELSDKDLVDAVYERVRIMDTTFEYIIVLAAKEIASERKGILYDPRISSPLIDRYKQQSQASEHAQQVIVNVREIEQQISNYPMFPIGFAEAVRRIELLEGGA